MKAALALFSLFPTMALAAAQSFSIESLVSALIYLVVIGLIFYCVWWFVGWIGLPEPFGKVVRVIIGLVALLILIYFLLGFLGPMPTLR